MRGNNTKCLYAPLEEIGYIPERLILNCRWGWGNAGIVYDRAYTLRGKWYLMWNDKEFGEPSGVQMTRTKVV